MSDERLEYVWGVIQFVIGKIREGKSRKEAVALAVNIYQKSERSVGRWYDDRDEIRRKMKWHKLA